jgi:hypothetical protein
MVLDALPILIAHVRPHTSIPRIWRRYTREISRSRLFRVTRRLNRPVVEWAVLVLSAYSVRSLLVTESFVVTKSEFPELRVNLLVFCHLPS